jgi:hypothetical protein
MYLLRPDSQTTQSLAYCLAVAAKRYSIEVHWVSALSTHLHMGIRDILGNYPQFLQYFYSLTGRLLNAQRGRWENFWAAEQPGVLLLADADAVFRKQIYGLSNPTNSHLVDRVFNWPGLNSLRYQLAGKPMKLKRPAKFFDVKGDLPAEISLEFKRPPEFEHLSEQQWADRTREAIERAEAAAAAKRQEKGLKVLGRKAVLQQSPFQQPQSTTERRGMVPRIATTSKKLRTRRLKENREFVRDYHEAFKRFCAGDHSVLFPTGTYQLVQVNLVHCMPAPAPT